MADRVEEMETMTDVQLSLWLEKKGYSREICDAFMGKPACN